MIESDLWGLLTEATSAKHQIILSNQTATISTGTAIHINLLEFQRTKSENRDHIHEDECNQD